MRLLDRYIANAIAGGVMTTLFVLLSLFAFFGFVEEMGEVGRGRYGVWEAGQYVFISLVPIAYQLFPIAALIGCIMGLGALAGNGELTAIRAAGVSLNRLLWSVTKVGLLMMLLALLLGETVAPHAEEYAQKLRSEAISGDIKLQGEQGMWVKDNHQFIHIQDLISTQQLANLTIYQLSDNSQLMQVSRIAQAEYRADHWVLHSVAVTDLVTGIIQTHATLDWLSTLDPEMLEVVQLDPDAQSIWGLYQYVHYLQDNGLASGRYEMALWSKLMTPLVTLVMMLLAVPFVMGSLRSVGIGQRILVGTLIGLGFHLLNQMSNYVGLVFGFNAMMSALAPTVIVSVMALLLIRRLH